MDEFLEIEPDLIQVVKSYFDGELIYEKNVKSSSKNIINLEFFKLLNFEDFPNSDFNKSKPV